MEMTNRIKVLMTTDTIGGVWTYCMDLCRTLEGRGVDVHLVTMGRRMNEAQRHEAEALDHVEMIETDFLLEWMQNPWRDIEECGEWLLQLERKIKPDLVHLNCFAYGCLPFKAPVMVVAHSDVYSWFLSVIKDDPPREWMNYYRCVNRGLKNADLVVAPSQWMMDMLCEIYNIRSETRVVYNGRSATGFEPGVKKQSTVFGMGRLWDEAKNTSLLVKASSQINAPVRIAGDDQFEDSRIALNTSVSFLGRLSSAEVAAELSSASVFVHPAKYEPFGLAPLEAALSGCALVLGDIPSLREIWQDAAVYVDTDDADSLAATVNALLQDPSELESWQTKATLRAKLFTAEAMAEEYLDLYGQLMEVKTIERKKQVA